MSRPHLTVAASLPQLCIVCQGDRAIPVVSLLGFPTFGQVACPHCVGVEGKQVEIPELPHYEDVPQGGVA